MKYKGSPTALRDVSFSADAGQIVALIGLNGAGKSTTLRAVSGFLPFEEAEVSASRIDLDKGDIRGLRPDQITNAGIGLVPERNKIFAELTVHDNLRLGNSKRRRSPEDERIGGLVMDAFPMLGRRMSRLAGLLSGGERQQLAISTALLRAPRILLIDEMSLGLSPVIVATLTEALKLISDELGLTIVVVEQSAHVAVALASYLYVLEDGMVIDEGPTSAMSDADELAARYLGLDA